MEKILNAVENIFLWIIHAATKSLKDPIPICKWENALFPLQSILGKITNNIWQQNTRKQLLRVK